MKRAFVPILILLLTTPAAAQSPPAVAEPEPEPAQNLADPPIEPDAAPPPPTFGSRGQWVLSNDLGLNVDNTTYATSEVVYTRFRVVPSIDWFPVDHFSIGAFGSGSVAYSKGYHNGVAIETDTTTGWGLGARFGWNAPLNPALSIWPRASFQYGASNTHPTSSTNDGSLRDLSDRGATVGVSVPLLVHVAPHAFVGLGPEISRTLAHVQHGYAKPTGDGTFIGASFTVGGWL